MSRVDPFVVLAELERARPAGAPALGEEAHPRQACVRIVGDDRRAFHVADIEKIEVRGDEITVTTGFVGLAGTTSPLPGYLVEAAQRSPSLRRLLGVLEHRLVSLLHRGLQRVNYASSLSADLDDPISRRLLSHSEHLRELVPASARIRLLQLPGARIRSARGLRRALAALLADDLAGAQIAVEEHVGARRRLCRRGSRGVLGVDIVVGDEIDDHSGSFRVAIGPVPRARARGFVRGGPELARVFAVVRALCPAALSFDVRVRFAPGAARRARLGGGCALAVDAWLAPSSAREIEVVHDTP